MSHVVARIGKPHGIRGEVTVQLHTDDPRGRFAVGTVLPTRARAGSGVPRTLTVRAARDHNGTWLLAFEEIPDRTGAEALRGTRLLTPETRPDPAGLGRQPTTTATATTTTDADADADEWYAEELEGLPVTRTDGTSVGTVTGLELGPGQDRLVIALLDGRSATVPFVSALVPVVDVPARRVVIDPPPGLLELS
jgi:16S rRNA processing protein RimM